MMRVVEGGKEIKWTTLHGIFCVPMLLCFVIGLWTAWIIWPFCRGIQTGFKWADEYWGFK